MEDQECWFDAIVARDYYAVQENLLSFAGSQNEDGLTGLILAVQNDDPKMVRILVENEAKLTNNDGDTALMIAARLNMSSCIPILLPYFSDYQRDDLITPLMVAAEAGSIHALRILLFHYGDETDSSGLTALDYASRAGHHECVESLLRECPFNNSARIVAAENAQTNGYDSLALYIMNTVKEEESNLPTIDNLTREKDTELERLQDLLQTTETRNSELIETLSSIQAEAIELKEQNSILINQESNLQKKIQELTEKLNNADPQIVHLLEEEGQKTDQQSSIDDLYIQLAEQSAIQERLQAEANDLRADNDKLLCNLRNVENMLADTEKRLERKIMEFGEKTAELDAKQLEIDALQEALQDANSKYDTLAQRLAETEQSLKKEDMFKAIENVELAIGANVHINEANDEEIHDLRQERDELQMQIEAQETQIKILKGKLDRLAAKNENIEQKYQALNIEFKLQSEQLSETQDLLRITEKKLHSGTSAQQRTVSNEDENNNIELLAAQKLISDLQKENAELRQRAVFESARAELANAEIAVHKSLESRGSIDSMLVKSGLIDMNAPSANVIGIDIEKETQSVGDQQQRVNELKVVEECLQRTIDEKKQILAALDSNLAHSKSQESALKKQKKQLDNVVNRLETLEKENEKKKKAAKHQPSAISRNVRSVSAAAKVVAAIARITEEENFNHDIVVKALVDTTAKLEEQIDDLAEENEKLKHELTNAINNDYGLQVTDSRKGSITIGNKNSARSSSKSRSRSNTSSSKHASSSYKASRSSISHHMNNTDNNLAPQTEEKPTGALKITFGLSGEQASALLEARLATYTPLMRAIMKGKVSDIEANLEYAGHVAPDGKTALMLAAEYNRVSSVPLLLEKEAGIKDSCGQMAIHIALQRGHYEVAEQLRKAEGLAVEPIERVNGIRTQLMSAAESNDVYAVWSLIPTQGALQDAEGITALMLAAGAGHKQIVALLIGSEAKIQTAWGTTALMWACQFGHIDCVRMLIPKEIRLRDRRGRSALHYATEAARHANADVKKAIEGLLRQHIA